MGKNAKETAEEIANLLNDGNFNPIAVPAPPAAMASPPRRSTTNFESRKRIEDEIIDSLKQSSVGMIGIYGMGGVGKTTMAKRIGERVKEEDLFDEVVMVTVSETIDMPKIQNEIAELLGLKLDVTSISARAHKLRTRLMDTKRKIIILDDVWDSSIRFEDLGIHIESNFEKCKVLLTSRFRDTCKQFKIKVVFDLKILEEKEAWILFEENAGKCVEDSNSNLHRVARDVAKECKGLPIALVTVGIVLRDVTNINKWRHALSQLRQSNPKDFPKVLRDVYNPLKLSYDNLENDGVRNLFIMCCLLPEDYNIPIEQLTWYSMGLRLFDDITNIEEARNQTHTLVENLKSRSLLIAGKDKLHVKMHDVVRDVAIYIGSRKNHVFLKSLHRSSIENSSDVNLNCNWMSVDISDKRMEVPVLSRFPKLQLLMWSSKAFYDISHLSFEGMENLKVLSFEDIWIGSLPPTLGSLKNLQTLRLFHCQVENISVIGELTSLKILSCNGCKNIKELPAEIGRLKGLRLLELNGCRKLQRIPFGIISSLRRLEELKMRRSFSRWEAEENGKERRNASLRELEFLPNLSCLEIEIDDCTLSAQEIEIYDCNLVKYYIRFGFGSDSDYYYFGERDYEKGRDYEKVMILDLPSAVGNRILLLARNAESLTLRGDGSENINLAETENLRRLEFSKCSAVKKLVDTKDGIVFRLLEFLILNELESLEEICDRNQNFSLCNLKFIKITSCPKLRSLFSVSVATRCLLQLEVLQIENCDELEEVFWNDDNTDGCIEFPKLKELRLWNLPNLTAFCRGLENIIIKFPNLTEMDIGGLPKLSSLSTLNSETVENSCFHLFCNSKDLLQLEILEIEDCESMEQVFWNEIKDDNTDSCIEFPKLKKLRLWNLPNLTAFCQGLENIIIKFPNLIELEIGGLPKLNSLSPLNSEILVCHNHTATSLHFVCNSKVEMGCLKHITLSGFYDNIKNIWCHQIPNNVFNNLRSLQINFMNDIRSLMSTSIAKNLVSLKSLYILHCKEMVEVIKRDDDNKQVVNINCLFPNLRKLHMWDLDKLRWFWQWNHALELPLLETVNICNCSVMETFTLGSINTPNIREIDVNSEKIDDQKDLNDDQKDLNDVILHIWTESQDKSKADGDRNENQNENEKKDESKDEYINENVNKDENNNERN